MIREAKRGTQYGEPVANRRGKVIVLFRGPRQACRYYDRHGKQIGPEHTNVVPAVVWARANGFDLRSACACGEPGTGHETSTHSPRHCKIIDMDGRGFDEVIHRGGESW